MIVGENLGALARVRIFSTNIRAAVLMTSVLPHNGSGLEAKASQTSVVKVPGANVLCRKNKSHPIDFPVPEGSVVNT